MSPTYDVAVVGAGAAGLMTAIFAARRRPALSIVLLEGMRRPGAKILVSGGGRCNVTNRAVRPRDFHGDRRAIARILARFDADDTVAFFDSLGVKLVLEPEFGKLFPADDRARSVLQALLDECTRRGVELRAGFRVAEIGREAAAPDATGPRVFVARAGREVGADRTAGAEHVRSRALVLATGGRSLPKSGSDGAGYGFARALGHTVTPTHPALVALVLDPHPFPGLAGVSFPAELQVWRAGRRVAAVRGPVLVTHFGLSGPAALDVSRHLAPGAAAPPEIRLSLFPDAAPEDVERRWLDAARTGSARAPALLATLPARLVRALLERAQVAPATPLAALARDARRRLLAVTTAFTLPVTGTRGFTEAEVTAGGVPLAEIDPATMASRVCPGLHLAGEILDVDGRLGGFNFQWAWSTGFVAGEALGGARGQFAAPTG